MKKEAEFHISDGQYLTMKTTYTVQMKDKLRLLIGEGKSRDLDITITCEDLTPAREVEVFILFNKSMASLSFLPSIVRILPIFI